MALVLAIDIRNTRTRIGLALDGRLVSQWAVPTDPDETADGAVACVLGFFDALARGLAPIEEGAPWRHRPSRERAFGGRGHHRLGHPGPHRRMGRRGAASHGRAPAHRGPGPEDGPQDELLRSCGRGRRPRRRDGGRQEHLPRAGPRHRSGYLHHLRAFGRDGSLPRRHHRPGHETRRPGAGPRGRPAGRRGASSPQVAARPHHRRGHAGGHRHGGGGPHRRPHRYDLGRLRLHDPRHPRGPRRRDHRRAHGARRHRRPDPSPSAAFWSSIPRTHDVN